MADVGGRSPLGCDAGLGLRGYRVPSCLLPTDDARLRIVHGDGYPKLLQSSGTGHEHTAGPRLDRGWLESAGASWQRLRGSDCARECCDGSTIC
jgi:hypothetical protein